MGSRDRLAMSAGRRMAPHSRTYVRGSTGGWWWVVFKAVASSKAEDAQQAAAEAARVGAAARVGRREWPGQQLRPPRASPPRSGDAPARRPRRRQGQGLPGWLPSPPRARPPRSGGARASGPVRRVRAGCFRQRRRRTTTPVKGLLSAVAVQHTYVYFY